jgi:quercetin dioxygenase-like cupin family protein
MNIHHHFGGGVYVKETRIPAGSALVQHRHAFDHLSYLVSGSVEVHKDGAADVVHAPACLTIAAGAHHGVKALSDAVWLCIWPEAIADRDDLTLAPAGDMQAMAEGML